MTNKYLLPLIFLLGFAIQNQARCTPENSQIYAWGKSEGGLKIGVSKKNITAGVEYPFDLIIAIQNVSLSKTTINLGIASGRNQYPFGIHLLLKSPNGKVQSLDYRGPAGIAGRVDPFLVSLPAGSTYTLSCNINQFTPLLSGRYKLSVQFEGNDGTTTFQQDRNMAINARPFAPHLDMLVALTPHWIGVIRSGEISVSVNRRAPVFTE